MIYHKEIVSKLNSFYRGHFQNIPKIKTFFGYADIIILRPLKIQKTENMKNTINSIINGRMMVTFCTGVAHDKTIPHAK